MVTPNIIRLNWTELTNPSILQDSYMFSLITELQNCTIKQNLLLNTEYYRTDPFIYFKLAFNMQFGIYNTLV